MVRRGLLAGALALALAPPAVAGYHPAVKTPPITDPRGFIAMTYRKMAADSGYLPPEDIFTPHLQSLFDDERRDSPKGELGRYDFCFWINAQEWDIKGDIIVTAEPVEGNTGRQVITAKFVSIGKAVDLHFYFERVGHRWLIDDVRSALPDLWTLSTLLKYGYDGPVTPGAGF